MAINILFIYSLFSSEISPGNCEISVDFTEEFNPFINKLEGQVIINKMHDWEKIPFEKDELTHKLLLIYVENFYNKGP